MMKIPKVKQLWVPWEQWECIPAGMYQPACCKRAEFEQRQREYASFLSDLGLFAKSAMAVTLHWPLSCVNFLTNEQINRIAWIGQASACYAVGLGSAYRGGFWLLPAGLQKQANSVAENILKGWVDEHNRNRKENRPVRCSMGKQMLFEWDSGRSSGVDQSRTFGTELQTDCVGDSQE